MKRNILTTIAALVALPFALAQAGEVYYAPAKDCKAPVCGDPCGYIFAYGGHAFDFDRDLNEGGVLALIDDHDGGFLVGGGVGVYSKFLCGSRFEIEGLHAENDYTSFLPNGVADGQTGQTKTQAVMFNLLKEIPLGCFTGYIGGGIGYGWTDVEIDNTGLEYDTSSVAYQAIAGLDIPLSQCVALFTQYKLLGIGDDEVAPGIEFEDHIIHSVSAGIRFSF